MQKASPKNLLWTVFDCHACPASSGFAAGTGGRYLKFPPTIGAPGKAELLFIGINPRLSGNRDWLARLIGDRDAFEALTENRRDGEAYIRAGAGDPHYQVHVRIVQDIYGPAEKFEEHAAVTELFFCATVDTSGDFPQEGSDCADEYFGDVLAQVQPKAIVCLGERVLRYMQARFRGDGQRVFRAAEAGALIVCVPHPGNDNVADADREFSIKEAVNRIRGVIGL